MDPRPDIHAAVFDDPDYLDHFVVTVTEPFASIDDVVHRLALRQPAWLTRISMGISDRDALERAVAERGPLGNWAVLDRTDDTVVFGEDMRVMRYRVVYELEDPTTLHARTEVVQQTRWFGPIYWALATPLHRRFLPRLLRNAGGAGSSVAARR